MSAPEPETERTDERPDGTRPRDRTPETSIPPVPRIGRTSTFRIDDLEVLYIDTDPEGGKPPLVFVHGYGGCGYEIRWIAPALSRRFRLIAPDLPGMGFSDRPERFDSIEIFVRTVAALMERLELPRITLVGHSLGGAVAATFADRYPDRLDDLVLIAPYGLEGEQGGILRYLGGITPLVSLAFSLVNRRLYRTLLELSVFHDAASIPDDLETYLAESLLSEDGGKTLAAITTGLMNSTVIEDILPRIERFVLLIWGEDDRVLQYEWAERFQSLLPLSKLVPIPDCGHMPHVEHPGLTADAILEFCSRRNRPSDSPG
jgi:abhydrolase domain-containing protein 6